MDILDRLSRYSNTKKEDFLDYLALKSQPFLETISDEKGRYSFIYGGDHMSRTKTFCNGKEALEFYNDRLRPYLEGEERKITYSSDDWSLDFWKVFLEAHEKSENAADSQFYSHTDDNTIKMSFSIESLPEDTVRDMAEVIEEEWTEEYMSNFPDYVNAAVVSEIVEEETGVDKDSNFYWSQI